MRVLEAAVKREVKRQLKALEAYQHWPVMQGFGAVTLDRIACVGGRYMAIETKAFPGKKPTPLQLATIKSIRDSGGIALVISSVDEAKCLPELLAHERAI